MLGHATYSAYDSAQQSFRAKRKSRESQRQLTTSPSYDDEHSSDDSFEQHPRIDHHFKPKKEFSVITKHQRRQQRKLKHLQNNSPARIEMTNEQPILHHRAWSAVKEEASNAPTWHYVQEV